MAKLRNKHLNALNLKENSSPSPDKIWKAYSSLYMEYKLDKKTNKEILEKKIKEIAAAKDFLDKPQDEQDRLENEDEENGFNDGFEPAGKRDNSADRFFDDVFKIRAELQNEFREAKSKYTESLKRQEKIEVERNKHEEDEEEEEKEEEDKQVRDFRAFQRRHQPEFERKEEEIRQRQKQSHNDFQEFRKQYQQNLKKTKETSQKPKEEKRQIPDLEKRYQQELKRKEEDQRLEAEKREKKNLRRKAKFLQLAKSHLSPILSAVLAFIAVSLFTYFCQATLLTAFGLGFVASLGVYYIAEHNNKRLKESLSKYADPSNIAEIKDKMTISALKAGVKANTWPGYLPSFWNYATYRRKDAFDTGLIISKANDQTALKEVNKLKI